MSCNLVAECAGIKIFLCVKGSMDMCSSCGKKHIDLREDVEWESQYPYETSDEEERKKQDKACFKTCKNILKKAGLSEKSAGPSPVYQIAKEKSNVSKEDKKELTKYLQIDAKAAEDGLSYIDGQLAEAYPVLVGVNYKYGSLNNDETTDHFIVIIGRGCEDNKTYYLFYEVGTKSEDKGKSDENKLYLEDDNTLRGTPHYNLSRKYIVSQVRRNVLP